ncbi:MAG: hypothetical protein GF416_07625 [Candidatus Altiarchaeales archaeon]|nr:hypothetical protein [Candidatus Altiarchaeales archaeon]MBD3416981.1 hypothetical protein [Candidatus Altiarchaeales archaeon]
MRGVSIILAFIILSSGCVGPTCIGPVVVEPPKLELDVPEDDYTPGGDPDDWKVMRVCGDGYLSDGEQCDLADHPKYGLEATGKGRVYPCPEGVLCTSACRCTEEAHYDCVDAKCVLVPGDGDDLCEDDRDCELELCGNGVLDKPFEECDKNLMSAFSVEGTLNKEIPCPDPGMACIGCKCIEPWHYECVEGSCQPVEGRGDSTCRQDEDCWHMDCVNRKCVKTYVGGHDKCQTDRECGCLDTHFETKDECLRTCDPDHEVCELTVNDCYYCKHICPGDTYVPSDCGGNCAKGYDCVREEGTECYKCEMSIGCFSSADCGEAYTKLVCYNQDVYEQKYTPYCSKPGTPGAQCKEKTSGITRGGQILPPLEDCDPGYCWQGQCVDVIPDTTTTTTVQDAIPSTTLQEQTPTTTTVGAALTCEQQGMSSTQQLCNLGCHEPDYCQYNEAAQCWVCVDVRISCGGSLYDNSNCDGECNRPGWACTPYQGGPCYACLCPDLIVTSLQGSVSLSQSTTCKGEACTTDCSLSATANIKIRNIGDASAPASTARVSLSPAAESDTASIESLAAGAVSGTKTIYFSKFATVSGKTCDGLSWWTTTYTFTATADYGNAIVECEESNNENSVATSAS